MTFSKKHCLITAGAGVIVVLLAAWLLYASFAASRATASVVNAADHFFSLAASGRTHDAYLLTSSGTRAVKSEATFVDFLHAKHLDRYVRAAWSPPQVKDAQTELSGRVEVDHGFQVPVRLVLVWEDAAWKIGGLFIEGPTPASPPPPNTPTPDAVGLQKFVGPDLDLFRQAVVRQDFQSFYDTRVSPVWRQEVTLEMMRRAFLGVLDDLKRDQNKTGPLVFDATPSEFDENGYLNVFGSQALGKDTLIFQLAYRWEKPVWRLVGIRVNVRTP